MRALGPRISGLSFLLQPVKERCRQAVVKAGSRQRVVPSDAERIAEAAPFLVAPLGLRLVEGTTRAVQPRRFVGAIAKLMNGVKKR